MLRYCGAAHRKPLRERADAERAILYQSSEYRPAGSITERVEL
jgi:hypothetical protein